ncbi:MAG: FAD-binding protein [bacterium]|nr:FAD-binding protein [bacterium]
MLNIFQEENLQVKENEPLAPYTTFKVGGPAKYFLITQNNNEVAKAVQIAIANKIPFYILGGGSNSLISDKGFDGLVIKIHNTQYKIHNTFIEAGSGVLLGALVAQAALNGLTGLEWAVGIPGTIGGAVRGNAGAYGHSISETIKSVQFFNSKLSSPFGKGGLRGILTQKMKKLNPSLSLPLRKGDDHFKIQNFDNNNCLFNYRSSVFKQDKNLIILEVELKLERDAKEAVARKMREILTQRKNKIPSFPCAGCFFQNIKIKTPADLSEKLSKELPKRFLDVLTVPAAWLIEECGLKGKQIGGAKVFDEHSNVIINTGGAKTEDIIKLAGLIKQRVRDKFGIQLEEEVELVGF